MENNIDYCSFNNYSNHISNGNNWSLWHALTGVKSQNVDLLFKSGLYMVIFTVFSMICMYAVSRLSVRVSSNATFNIREKIFHILMNLSDEEIGKFKITALITWSTRSMSIEQGFIVMVFEQLMLIPFTFIAIYMK